MAGFASLLAASAALRIASLDLCADEYLLLLARPGEIASVSRLSHDPADSVLWRAGRRFPANRGDIASVLPTHPNLLLAMGGGARSTRLIASKFGLRTVDLAYPASIAEVEARMIDVARALGDVHRADPWRRRLAAIRARSIVPRDTIFIGGGGNSVSPGSVSAEWMMLAGMRQRILPGGRATLETLTVRPPSLLLRSNYRRDQPSLGQRWLDHPLVRSARSRRIDTDGRPWTCAGPAMVSEIERLARLP